ncbi:MAG TPA: hypothetical protein VF756_15875 [Thermoanaerobaculia bacterium]
MTRFFVRATVLAVLLATLAAAPVAAAFDMIKKGTDYWRTPGNGVTQFTFPDGDVESLCKVPAQGGWDHKISLRGIPAQGSDWDAAVARLDHAKFDKSGNARTRVQFQALAMTSIAASDTPCGKLFWTARLAKRKQPVTEMRIKKTSDRGGAFFAELALSVELQASRADTGASIGSLFYDIKLPDPTGGTGTPWSYGPNGGFRPGMTETDNCIQVLREKLGDYPPGSQHIYFISNLIAQGKCRRGD